MHELSIANAIVGEIRDAAERHGVSRVSSVSVRVGRLSGVVAGALEFGWSVVREGTEFAETELLIEDVAVQVWCPGGGHTLTLDDMVFRCEEHDCATPDVLDGERLEISRFESADVADPAVMP